jgi:hypothetical protein
VPIPFVLDSNNDAIFDTDLINNIIKIIAKEGTDA